MMNPFRMGNQIKSLVKHTSKVFCDSSLDKVPRLVSWKQPHENVIKLNVDGSSNGNQVILLMVVFYGIRQGVGFLAFLEVMVLSLILMSSFRLYPMVSN